MFDGDVTRHVHDLQLRDVRALACPRSIIWPTFDLAGRPEPDTGSLTRISPPPASPATLAAMVTLRCARPFAS
jgi:hypothetical protein